MKQSFRKAYGTRHSGSEYVNPRPHPTARLPIGCQVLYAKRELEAYRAKQKTSREKQKAKHLARMENDPDYRRQWQEKEKARSDANNLKAKQKRRDLKERSKTDPTAAAEYEALRIKEREREKRNKEKRRKLDFQIREANSTI